MPSSLMVSALELSHFKFLENRKSKLILTKLAEILVKCEMEMMPTPSLSPFNLFTDVHSKLCWSEGTALRS